MILLTDHLGPGALFNSKILEKHFSSVCRFLWMLVKFHCCDKMPETINLKGGLFWLELLFVLFCFCGEERMKREVGRGRAQTLSSWCRRGRERRNDQGQDTAFKYTSLVTRSLHPDLTTCSTPPPESDTGLQIHPWISHVIKRHHEDSILHLQSLSSLSLLEMLQSQAAPSGMQRLVGSGQCIEQTQTGVGYTTFRMGLPKSQSRLLFLRLIRIQM